jgi:hypothetical protein
VEQSVGDVKFSWVDPAITRGHHDMSHDGDTRDTIEMLTKINIWYRAAQLPHRGDEEDPGRAIRQHDARQHLISVNELSKGSTHSHPDMPFLLPGHAGGALPGGQFLKFSGTVSHNNLLVSCLNLMDVPATTFGNPAYCTGRLTGV